MLRFLVLSIFVLIYIFIIEKKDISFLKKFVGFLIVLLIYSTVAYFMYQLDYLGETRFVDKTPIKEVILFLLMSFGMIASVLNSAIEKMKRERSKSKDSGSNKISIDKWEFLNPLLISVGTFCFLMTQIGDESITWSNATIAFQTGFFWNTVMKNKFQHS